MIGRVIEGWIGCCREMLDSTVDGMVGPFILARLPYRMYNFSKLAFRENLKG